MKVGSLKPFDDGKYLSEEEALKLLETIPIPKEDTGHQKSNFDPDLAEKLMKYYEEHPEEQESSLSETPAPPVSVTSIDDFVVLRNLRCIDADGNVFEQYSELYIAKDVVRRADRKLEPLTPYQAAVYFEKKGSFLPSMALSCNIVAALFKAAIGEVGYGYFIKDADLLKVLDQYKNNHYYTQNTIVDWNKRKIIHYPHDSDFPQHGGNDCINQSRPLVKLPIPTGISDMALAVVLQNAEATRYVRNLTGLENPDLLVQVGGYFGRTPRILIPFNCETETYAAGLGCNYGYFDFYTRDYLGNINAARGVCLNPTPPKSGGSP